MAPAPRIAIVDDELSVRTALGRLLTAASFDVMTYGSAREFIDSLRFEAPDSLVADVHMPDFSGLDLLHYLRRAKRSIPVIIVTAFDELDLRAQCLASGAVAYFTKPLDGAELVGAVRAAVGHGRSHTRSQAGRDKPAMR
jgi:FixJ family two-component response regulator